jgi:hypothetical protein
MTKMGKKELILSTKPRYLKASKKDKTKILDEFCKNTGYDRKYAISIFQAKCDYNRASREGRKPRAKKYGHDVMTVIIKIWELLDHPCGVRLKPSLMPMLESMTSFNEISVTNEIKDKMESISARTLDRRLDNERQIRKLNKNRGTTRHGSLLKTSIPIRITDWDTETMGYMEIDTVSHNGGDPGGEFASSLDMVEIFSGWSEQAALMGKGEIATVKAVEAIKEDLPFWLLGLDSDGGSEFINWHMVRYCEKKKLFFTRSRPDRKNDNAYVEQKNNTHIRQLLGYGRFDTVEQINAINDLYRNELRLFNNFFKPVMKIASKEKINNSVFKKKYDIAKTPYQRLIESGQLPEGQAEKLTTLYKTLNPVQLKRAINEKVKKIKKMQS